MNAPQPGILAPLTPMSRHITFDLSVNPHADATTVTAALQALRTVLAGTDAVTGIGRTTVSTLGRVIDGLDELHAGSASGASVPSTPAALWVWLRGHDRGDLVLRSHQVIAAAASAFVPRQTVDAFVHADSRDLSGYEDGTENPQGDNARAAAIVSDRGDGLDGGSFVAIQQWVHDFAALSAMTQRQRDLTIGRRLRDNVEIPSAPASAHVKRTAQETFTPPAFIVRRSAPWSDGERAGLVFVAFGKSLVAFQTLLDRMLGHEPDGTDSGIVDALFAFTRPVTGCTFWCPPLSGDQLDLRALGIAGRGRRIGVTRR